MKGCRSVESGLPRGVWDTIFVIEIPEIVRHQAVNVGADDWLASLSDIVSELATGWNITVGTTFPDATEAYVAQAVRDDGELLVLKIHIPREGGFVLHESAFR